MYLEAADRLLHTALPGAVGTWPRACAWLLRIELETALDGFWARTCPEVGTATRAQRTKLLMLTAYADPGITRRAGYAWWALSRAGHHHHYELGVTATELARLRDEVVELIRLLRAHE
ncbi:hypothetical protein Acy02nite_86050 [Actinoplanes cyaneus]|uniref:Uncharacterized protein n=1 Tax=Actinoplanes cyaneus TaxID=52696 RepID=A0A919IR94_9ACTN|nr:hypothetical protein Acy02nite_86050 [Actinoplanes cyaneus]